MPTLNIDGVGKVTVDDNFLDRSPSEQQAIVEDIAKQVRSKGAAASVKSYNAPPAAAPAVQAPPASASGTVPAQSTAGAIGQYAAETAGNIPGSAAKVAQDLWQTVRHPIETATNIGMIGKGVLQKLGIAQGKEAEPYAEAVGRMLVDRYGSGEAIKNTLKTDPVGMAADIATVLGGGELALARAPGMAGEVGRAAGTVGRAVDPLSTISRATKAAGGLASEALGVTTGAGGEAIRTAARAGAEGGEAGKAFRESMTGAMPAEQIVADAKGAVSNLRKQRGELYRSDMARISESTEVLDFDKIDTAVSKVSQIKTFKGQNISPKTEGIRQELLDAISAWKNLDPAQYHTPEGLDALKQQVGEIRDATQYGTPQRVAADEIYQAVRKTIVAEAPEYAKIMKGYETATNEIKEIERTLSVNPKASVDTALRKILSALRDNVNTNYAKRRELVGFLARSGATHLLEKIAGQSLKSAAPRGLARVTAGGEGIGALAAFAAGNPGVAGAMLGGLAASSPALVGGAAYGAGVASRLPLRRAAQAARLAGATGSDTLSGQ